MYSQLDLMIGAFRTRGITKNNASNVGKDLIPTHAKNSVCAVYQTAILLPTITRLS